jgi:hypothetical protein
MSRTAVFIPYAELARNDGDANGDSTHNSLSICTLVVVRIMEYKIILLLSFWNL